MTKIPEVLKSGSGKRWVWITGVVAIFALLFAIAWNIECERAVAPQELPGEARSFIAQHYPEENPVLVIKTLDELAVTYKVVFADGTQVKFRRNGMWREIKSRSRAVPSAVVPAQIADYVLLKSVGYFAFRKAVAECVSFTIAVASCYAVWFRRIFVSRSEESKGATVYRCKWS